MELYEHAHFDSYGVGENLITSASDPVFGGVYKLVAVKQPDGSYTPKMKCSDSASKAIIPGKKMPWRLYDENGQAQCDLIAMDGEVIEAGKPVTMVNLDSDAIERTVTFTPTAVKPLLVPHILGGPPLPRRRPTLQNSSPRRPGSASCVWSARTSITST